MSGSAAGAISSERKESKDIKESKDSTKAKWDQDVLVIGFEVNEDTIWLPRKEAIQYAKDDVEFCDVVNNTLADNWQGLSYIYCEETKKEYVIIDDLMVDYMEVGDKWLNKSPSLVIDVTVRVGQDHRETWKRLLDASRCLRSEAVAKETPIGIYRVRGNW